MSRKTIANIDCTYTLAGDCLAEPCDSELRAIIKQCKSFCPDQTFLQSVNIRFSGKCADVLIRYQGKTYTTLPRQGRAFIKPAHYTLYEAAELAQAKETQRFINTWRTCQCCHLSAITHPTCHFEDKWICRSCYEQHFENQTSKVV